MRFGVPAKWRPNQRARHRQRKARARKASAVNTLPTREYDTFTDTAPEGVIIRPKAERPPRAGAG